jgi:TonB-linked SusC/RagA family outer membrane protein
MKFYYESWFERYAPATKKLLLIMRLIILLLTAGLLQVNASGFAQRITLSESNASLKTIIKKIRIQSGYDFIGDASLINNAKNINIVIKEATLEEALDACFSTSDISYSIDNHIVAFKKRVISKAADQSLFKKIDVKGKVVDEHGTPLPGASVKIKGTKQGTQTDKNGEFALSAVEDDAILVVSFISYKPLELKVKVNMGVITLNQDQSTLNDVNVTVSAGYGTLKKHDLTDAVSSLDPKVLQSSTAISIGNMIQGQIAGVNVVSGSGAPGSPVRIRIRGDATISSGADPLIVIDGVPMPADYDLNDINPNDIEALDVLKGASATAIYGSRASAGIIEIRTKRGTSYTKPQISYSYNFGRKTLESKINALNSDQFISLFKEGLTNYVRGRFDLRGDDASVRSYVWPTNNRNYYDFYTLPGKFGDANTNWVDMMIRPAITQDHYVSLRGGDQKTQYSFSYGKNKENGMLLGSNFDRNTIGMNYDQRFSDKVKVGFSVTGGFNETNGTVTVSTATTMRPDAAAYNADGSYHIFTYVFSGATSRVDNPLILANDVTNRGTGKVLSASPYAELQLFKDLKFTSRYSYYYSLGGQRVYYPSTTSTGRNNSTATGSLSETESKNSNSTFTNYLSYLKTFNDHDITAVLGTESNVTTSEYITQRYLNFADDKIQNAAWQAAQYQYATGDATETAAIGYYGRVNYKYKDRYLLTSSFRVDGSSRFAPKYRYGFFPSISGAYIMSEAPFFAQLKNTVDLLKFRVSAGKTGNDRVGAYDWRSQYQSGVSYLDLPGVRPVSLGNDNLKWESTTEYNLGMDFGLFKNSRIRGAIDIYKKNVQNMLIGIPMAPSTGVTTVYQNFGNLTNKGIEFSLSGVVIQKGDFTWDIGANVSKNSNILTKLGIPRASFTDGSTSLAYFLIEEGKPLGLVYGYPTDGLFKNWAEVDAAEALNPNRQYQETSNFTIPGDIKFKDVSGDGYVSSGTGKDSDPHEDRRVLGSTQPDFTGGFNSTVQYKGLRLDIRGTFQKGGVKYWKYGETQFQMNAIAPTNVDAIALQRWTPDNPNAKYPGFRDLYFTNRINDFWLYDASFLKIQEINLSYMLPKKLLEKTKIISGLSVYASLNNVFTFTKYPGYNVESFDRDPIRGTMMDNSAYPNERTFKIGARMMF